MLMSSMIEHRLLQSRVSLFRWRALLLLKRDAVRWYPTKAVRCMPARKTIVANGNLGAQRLGGLAPHLGLQRRALIPNQCSFRCLY